MKSQFTVKHKVSHNDLASTATNMAVRVGIAIAVLSVPMAMPETSSTAHPKCSIKETRFEGWAAQQMSNEWLQLIIVPQLGGRLMQVTFAGHPYLFVNPEFKGKYFPPISSGDQWFNYGGDKLWPLPEGKGDSQHWPGPISDLLDDGKYEFKNISEDSKCTGRLEGPADLSTGLQYSREITITAASPQISFHSIMKNAVDRTIRWSMQTVTQYDTSNRQQPADYNHNFWALAPLNPHSSYFNGYQVRSGLADDPSFAIKDSNFSLHWLYLENEVWLDSTAGWLMVDDALSQFAMLERFRYQHGAEYPGKASVIFYKNGAALELDATGKSVLRSNKPEDAPYYMEAEINSPMVELKPGESYSMDTSWLPTRVNGRATTATGAGVIAAPISAARTGNGVTIAGSLGVFFPGKLVANLFGRDGKQLQTVDLQPVVPQTAVQLQQEIRPSAVPQRISVNLIDDLGRDRGSLGDVTVSAGEKGSK